MIQSPSSDAPTLRLDTVVRRSDAMLSSNLGDDVVTMDIERGTYFGLDSVAGRIWTLLEAPSTVTHLCEQLVAEYQISREQCEREVLAFVSDLVHHHVVQIDI